MFDAVVLAKADAVAAARTLATLVEGVVEGHVRRLVIVADAMSEPLAALADQAGCRLEARNSNGEIGQQLAVHLSTPHVLVLDAGTLLEPNWTDALRADGLRYGAVEADQAVLFTPEEFKPRLKLRLALALRLPVPVIYGALVPLRFILNSNIDIKRVNFGRNMRLARVSAGR